MLPPGESVKPLYSLQRLSNRLLYTTYKYTPWAPGAVNLNKERCKESCTDLYTALRPGPPGLWLGRFTAIGPCGTPSPTSTASCTGGTAGPGKWAAGCKSKSSSQRTA